MIAGGRQFGRHRVALRPRRFLDQLARQDEMLGKPPGLVAVDRKLARAFIEEDARGASSSTAANRSEEHTSELQSLMRISYAVFCLKKKKIKSEHPRTDDTQTD